MRLPAPVRRHPWRVLAAAIVAVLVALGVVLAIHVHALLQPQRFTALLQGDLSSVGLSLKLNAPAEPMLFPHPGVRLEGLSLSNTGAGTPLLQAQSATIVVPWRALLRGEAAIERVDIDSPRLDLGELKALLARLPRHAPPPRLPTIATGVHLSDGTLTTHGQPLLFGINVNTGALAPGQAFRLDAAARSRSGRKLVASLVTVPAAPRNGAIEFAPITLALGVQGGPSLHLAGDGNWRGGESFTLRLTGTLQHAALLAPKPTKGSAPAASTDATSPPASDRVTVAVTPGHATTPMTITLKLDGADAHVDATLQPTGLATWWKRMFSADAGAQANPLPFTGTATIRQLDLGAFSASGVEIRATPATGASSSAPPSAATH